MRRDILSAYAASGSRVASWVIVSALVYRRSPSAFAMLALVRGTIGILNYAALGLLPAMIQAMANASEETSEPAVIESIPIGKLNKGITLNYFTAPTGPERFKFTRIQTIYATGQLIAVMSAMAGTVLAYYCATHLNLVFRIPTSVNPEDVFVLTTAMAAGAILRWLSDPAGALLQAQNRIMLDNWILAFVEVSWVLLTMAFLLSGSNDIFAVPLMGVSVAFLVASGMQLALRSYMGEPKLPASVFAVSGIFFRPLLTTGLLITLAQLADYLYSPTDYLLINHLLTPLDLAHYAPAVQIDSGLLLLVTALGSVLLPKTALAHSAGNCAVVRTYYLRGTLASAVTLIVASLVIYFAAPLIFRLWFGDAMPGTVAILPLVLLNTVIGGSSAVGRAILIGIGKTKPFTISVLIAGVTNVIASLIFVRYFHLGLNGIILGTIVAVVFRCGIWMPWYVLRELRIK